MLADRSRQLREAGLERAAEIAGAQELARRDEVADHAHEGIEQGGPGRQRARHAIREAPPADDELQAARDPFLVAKRAPPGCGIGRQRPGREVAASAAWPTSTASSAERSAVKSPSPVNGSKKPAASPTSSTPPAPGSRTR